MMTNDDNDDIDDTTTITTYYYYLLLLLLLLLQTAAAAATPPVPFLLGDGDLVKAARHGVEVVVQAVRVYMVRVEAWGGERFRVGRVLRLRARGGSLIPSRGEPLCLGAHPAAQQGAAGPSHEPSWA